MRSGWALMMAVTMSAGVLAAQTVGDASLEPRSVGAVCTVSRDAAWLTPAEKSCYQTTPDYEETMAYLRRMQVAAPGTGED